ncbi:hypothetical protein AAEH84_20240, partial [Shewanella indica]|uniref:hypothetical protein n=1 Tax=Shewanella indica TaxID=768528 RepID=UPI00313D9C38
MNGELWVDNGAGGRPNSNATAVNGGVYDRLVFAGGANVEVKGDVSTTKLETYSSNGNAGNLYFDGGLTTQDSSLTLA